MKYSQTIYLGVNDDIALAIDKVAEAGTPEIVLVIPPDAEIFSSIVNLKLLRREAENLSKHLVIATADKLGRHLVERAGIELDKLGDYAENKENNMKSGEKSRENFVEEKYLIKADKISSGDYKSQEKTGKNSLSKQPALPRMMVDIIIPIRKIDAANKKIEEKENENFILPEKNIEFKEAEDLTGNLIEAEEDSIDLSDPIQARAGHFQEPIETFWGQASHGPSFSNKDFEAEQKEPKTGEFMDIAAPVAAIRVPEERKRKKLRLFAGKKRKKLVYAFGAAGLVVFFVAAYFILPRAKLIISPKKQDVAYAISVVADKNITKVDYSLKRIPAQLIKVEKRETKDFPTTGESEGSQKARGIITIYNNYSVDPQGLVATTRFIAKDSGKLFRLVKTITVPGGKMEGGKLIPGSIDAEVLADQPGADYNIGPSDFSIPGFSGTPKYTGFYGKSKAAMVGGSIGKSKIVSAGDLENASKTLNDLLKTSQAQELKNQIPANMKLLDGALQEGKPEITFSASAGDAAENFTATIKVQIVALVFDPKYINDLAAKNNSALSSGKIDNRNIDYINWKVNFDKGQISMDLKISQEGTGKIDIANLKKILAGKDEVEIRKSLSQISEVQSAKISFWPFWVKSMPVQPSKIEVTIEQNN